MSGLGSLAHLDVYELVDVPPRREFEARRGQIIMMPREYTEQIIRYDNIILLIRLYFY